MHGVKKLPVGRGLSFALLILSGHDTRPSAEEPLGIGLEGFAYPYPVHMFVIPEGGERLNMAYMDVPPEGDSNGRTALLLHGRNFPSSYWQATIKALAAGRLSRRGSRPDRLRQIVEAACRPPSR